MNRSRLESRERRLNRQKHIWAVIRLMIIIDDLNNCESFYDLEKKLKEYNDIIILLKDKEYRPNNYEISAAIRFCNIKRQQNICDHYISDKEKKEIYNWEEYCIDSENLISKVKQEFKTYWDDVLNSYVRPSAKKKRKDYLINHLNEMKKGEYLSKIPNYNKYLEELIQHYSKFDINIKNK
jgi:hypothetical protein